MNLRVVGGCERGIGYRFMFMFNTDTMVSVRKLSHILISTESASAYGHPYAPLIPVLSMENRLRWPSQETTFSRFVIHLSRALNICSWITDP